MWSCRLGTIKCYLHTAIVRQCAEAMAAIGDVYNVYISNRPKTEPCGTDTLIFFQLQPYLNCNFLLAFVLLIYFSAEYSKLGRVRGSL